MKLTSENVQELFKKCVYYSEGTDNEISEDNKPEDMVIVEGIVHNYALNKNSLEENKEDISSMLHQLPKEFMESTGGGYSFLAACNDSEGHQWTGMHLIMESLFVLGLGLEIVKCLLPRTMWQMLPGGMPYYVITEGGH